jgi:hypothetical protein
MTLQLIETRRAPHILEVRLTGKLERDDYRRFVPEFEKLFRSQGKVSILVEMVDFHGWDAGALWEDLKFDLKHFSHVEQIAMVGDRDWQKTMSLFCKPFTTARVRYFDATEIDLARAWLEGIGAHA